MVLRASEESTTYYEFDEDLLKEYKEWAKDNNVELSKRSFREFVFNVNCIDDFEVDVDFSGTLDFENFDEWVNQ